MTDSQPRAPAAASGTVTFQGYLRILREQWRTVVTVLVLAIVASAVVAILRPPEYTARLTLYATAQPSGPDDSALQAGQLAQQRVASYKELVTSGRVLGQVVDRLNLDASPAEVAKRITTSSPPDSVLIEVASTGPTPVDAANVANALGAVMTDLVAELEKPEGTLAQPPVAIRVVDPASAPDAPSSPGLAVTLAFGMLVGVVLAAGSALARNAMDISIKSSDGLRSAAGVPVIATIEFDRQVRQRPLIVQRDSRAPLSETFRQLRTKLQMLDAGRSTVYVVTSPLPFEGKTTTSCNLAIALGSTHARTLLIEADLRQPMLARLLGLDPAIGLTSIIAGDVTAERAIQPWPAGNLDVLTSGPVPPDPSELLAAGDLTSLLSTLRSQYDAILIDTPPVLPVSDTTGLAPYADGTILLCRYRKTRQEHVRAAMEALDAVSARVIGTVLNRAPAAQTMNYPKLAARRRNLNVWSGNRPLRSPARVAGSAIRFAKSKADSAIRTRRM